MLAEHKNNMNCTIEKTTIIVSAKLKKLRSLVSWIPFANSLKRFRKENFSCTCDIKYIAYAQNFEDAITFFLKSALPVCRCTFSPPLNQFRMVLFGAAHGGCGGGRQKGPSSYNLSRKSYNDETWHSYSLPKEYPKNISITRHI